MPADVTVGHLVTLIHVTHIMVVIHHSLWIFGFTFLIAEMTFHWGMQIFVNMRLYPLSCRSIAIKSAQVLT
jgi:hypothetical protein